MKKLISVFICAIMILSLVPFTASAADEINFTLRIKSETDNDVVLTLDYEGGTGFCALDADITYDKIRLERKSCEKGDGYVAFEKYLNDNDALSMCSFNPGANPMKVSMANTLGFKAIGGKKSVITLKFAKVPGTKFAKDDVKIEFTNCQTAAFTDIKVNLSYDLKQPVNVVEKTDTTGDATEFPQQPSQDNIEGEESEVGDVSSVDGNSSAAEQDAEPQEKDEQANADADTGDTTTIGAKPDNTKKIIIIVAVVVVVLGAGAVVIVKAKGKKKND